MWQCAAGYFQVYFCGVCSFSGVDDFDHHGQSVFDQVRKLNGGSMSVYGENEDQGKYWNEKPGRSWVVHDHEMNNRFQNISDILFAGLDAPNLSNVLDIGCGAGATTLRMAKTLSGRGAVTGIDISDALLGLAREKASAMENLTFTWADAQSYQFEPAGFDGAFSRFGVMFFADPIKNFTLAPKSLHKSPKDFIPFFLCL